MTTVVASLAWTACSVAGPDRAVPVDSGKTFSLKIGESAQVGGESVRVGFERVTTDSRCPKGVQCVWAGDAAVRVWLQQGTGPKERRELHTGSVAAPMASALDYELRLVRLDPYPVAGRPVAEAEYVATLVLSRGRTADPER